jgi:hypothetical protein
MLLTMGAVLHRIEALPGEGRHAVTFLRADGTEQTAIVQLSAAGVDVAEASLPQGWTRESELFQITAAAVRAFADARRAAATAPALRDVPGGWDVSLGNVVVGDSGKPICTAHGEMTPTEGEAYVCTECGAQALLG